MAVHADGSGGWGCDAIATWLSDPLIAEIENRDEISMWCDCEWRDRYLAIGYSLLTDPERGNNA